MIINGDCLEEMRKMADNSIDCIVTDSPYGISFMSKGWDRKIPSIEYWQEMLRIVKPGGHILAAGLPRMLHRLTCVIEDAGWQIRDLIMHLFGSGFPKSHNFGKQLDGEWSGYGTALKPAYEGWILAMKPLDGSFAQNAERWGVSGINVDASRVGTQAAYINRPRGPKSKLISQLDGQGTISSGGNGRWPANLILDEEAAHLLGEPSRFFYCPKASSSERNAGLDCYLTVKYTPSISGDRLCPEENMVAVQLLQKVISDSDLKNLNIEESGESISAQFHKDFSSIIKMKIKQIIESKTLNLLTLSLTNDCIQDANLSLENGGNLVANVQDLKKWIVTITNGKMELALGASNAALKMLSLISDEGNWKKGTSSHPTVKPLSLLQYLIKLIMPPNPDAILLDPFCGSGTTVAAAKQLGRKAIGIELDPEYAEIARRRVEHAKREQEK